MFTLEPASVEDFDRLLQLRLRCMRESLERIGRFDEWRAYDRFRNSYRPHYTRLIMRPQAELAGCVAMGPADGDLLLEHFYIAPEQQGKGLGSAVLQRLLGEADAAGLPIRLSVLQQSDAGRFYARHGFTQTGEDEWDVYYRRPPRTDAGQLNMTIRQPTADDSDRICEVLRRSIKELCIEDHKRDAHILGAWLFNKTPENVLKWISDPEQHMLIAVTGKTILGVGAADSSGQILLNYVSPDARFHGISKAILLGLENYLHGRGNTLSRLTSTRTAHRFYQACGYADSEPAEPAREVGGQPMEKQLR